MLDLSRKRSTWSSIAKRDLAINVFAIFNVNGRPVIGELSIPINKSPGNKPASYAGLDAHTCVKQIEINNKHKRKKKENYIKK